MTENEKLVVVFTTQGAMRAEIIKAKLISAGIPALIRTESQNILPMTIDGMGKAEILVPQEHEQEAREIIAE
jgi:hypothetical protein